MDCHFQDLPLICHWWVALKKRNSRFLGHCSDQELSSSFLPCWIEHLFLIIITPRSSNLVDFFLNEIHGLSFSGFAINLSSCLETQGNRANPEVDSPSEITHKIKSSQPNLMILVLL